jgi:uncharacterized protein (TIGR02679 family)
MTWHRQLDRPELRPIWQKLHDRLSSGHPVARIRVGPLDETAQASLADLLGLDRLPGSHPTLALAPLEAAVHEISGLDVRRVLAELIGPVGDRAAAAQEARGQRDALWDWLYRHEVVTSQPALAEWADHLRSSGMPGAAAPAQTKAHLAAALTVLGALPADGEPLPVLAARLLHGDAHALDDGTRLSSLVLRALSTLYNTPMPENAQERRTLWSRAGVTDDELSSTVLLAGIRPLDDGPVGQITRICADAGHATSLTLAQLRATESLTLAADQVHIVENPSLVALALRRFGRSCPPLVCTSGWPNTTAIHLLRLLADQEVELRYHGDFDGEGIRIAAHVLARTSASPWRMTEQDYRAGAARVLGAGPQPGRLTPAPWDPDLTRAMEELRVTVMEEVVADLLLDDLAHQT